MTDPKKNKQELIDAILKTLAKEKGPNDNNEFLLESIVMLSSEVQSLVMAVDAMTNIVKYHNAAIEDLYVGQDVITKILKLPSDEYQDLEEDLAEQDTRLSVPKNKKDLN